MGFLGLLRCTHTSNKRYIAEYFWRDVCYLQLVKVTKVSRQVFVDDMFINNIEILQLKLNIY